jgi:hypothetical protein
MKTRTQFWTAAGLIALLSGLSIAAHEAAKVAGTWELSMEGRQGAFTQTMTLEQNGDKIKGAVKGPRAETPFEGTVKGNKISFTVKRDTPRGEVTLEYTGTVDGDSMKGTVSTPGGSRDWTARRAKEAEKKKD